MRLPETLETKTVRLTPFSEDKQTIMRCLNRKAELSPVVGFGPERAFVRPQLGCGWPESVFMGWKPDDVVSHRISSRCRAAMSVQ